MAEDGVPCTTLDGEVPQPNCDGYNVDVQLATSVDVSNDPDGRFAPKRGQAPIGESGFMSDRS